MLCHDGITKKFDTQNSEIILHNSQINLSVTKRWNYQTGNGSLAHMFSYYVFQVMEAPLLDMAVQKFFNLNLQKIRCPIDMKF